MACTGTTLTKIICMCFIAVLVALPVNAQEFKFQFNDLYAVNPSGTLETTNLGIGANLTFEFRISNHFALRESIHVVAYGNVHKALPNKDKGVYGMVLVSTPVPLLSATGSYSGHLILEPEYGYPMLGIGSFNDFIYRFNSHNKGLFVLVGNSNMNFIDTTKKERIMHALFGNHYYDYDDPIASVGALCVGLGYNFNKHCNFEAKYARQLWASIPDGDYGTVDYIGLFSNTRYDWIQASFLMRF
jgi:hypothetical protein